MTSILVIIIGAAIAGFVQGLSGFAFGMLSMAIWAWVIEPSQAAILVVFGALAGQIMTAFTAKRQFNIKILWPYLLGGLIGIPIGVSILPSMDMNWFKVFIGGFLLLFSSLMLVSKNIPKVQTKNKLLNSFIGVMGGVMSGLGGLSGVVPSLWCTLSDYDKDERRSIIQNFSLTMLAVTMATYAYKGMITADVLPLFAVILPSMFIPTWLGMRSYRIISPVLFHRIILILLFLAGLSMLVVAVPKILTAS